MALPLGSSSTVFRPLIRVANRRATVPHITTKYKAPWAGWDNFEYIPEDVTAKFDNPKQGIDTKDYGEIDSLPTGQDDVGLTMTTVRPKAIDLTRAYNMVQSIIAPGAERSRLVLSAGNTATVAVTVVVRLDTGTGVLTDFPVSIPAGQTAEQAAATIRGTAFTGHVAGGIGAEVTFVAIVAGPRLDSAFVGAGSVAGAMTTSKQFRPGFTHRSFNPNAETNFMVCLEGFAAEGGLYTEDKISRVFFWNVEQVSEGGGGGGGRRRGGGGGGGGGRRRG
ncbi:MAG: hypothetical protein M3P49_13835, partial [Actinomycetota bacterium]|nr:hypothetical protein [Actinomycetota bacterium]